MNSTLKSVLFWLAIVIAAFAVYQYSSVSTPAGDRSSLEATIRQLTIDWADAEASNDTEKAMGFLWEDATMQPPNAAEIRGHAAIRAAYQGVTFVSVKPGPTEVHVSADLAAIWGPLTVVIKGLAGPVTLNQKFIAVWQRRDGKWKVIENSWSDNAPPKAGG
jgi:ketosteroid isomerase-like protein